MPRLCSQAPPRLPSSRPRSSRSTGRAGAQPRRPLPLRRADRRGALRPLRGAAGVGREHARVQLLLPAAGAHAAAAGDARTGSRSPSTSRVAIVVSQLAVRARRRAEDASSAAARPSSRPRSPRCCSSPASSRTSSARSARGGRRARGRPGVDRARIACAGRSPTSSPTPSSSASAASASSFLDRVASPDPAALARVLPSLASLLASPSIANGWP